MYTCGLTVYARGHIGNFRTFVAQDVLRRFLRFKGYRVLQAMNFTDVDDKTIPGAGEAGEPLRDYTTRYIEEFFDDADALGIEPRRALSASHRPRVHRGDDSAGDATTGERGRLRVRRLHLFPGCELPPLRGSSPARRPPTASPAPAWTPTSTTRKTRRTSSSGRWRNRVTRSGMRLSAPAVRVGIWNVQQWDWNFSARVSTCTAAAWISCSRTTRTRSPRARPRPGAPSFVTGSTANTCWWTAGKCPNRSAINSPCAS